MRPLFIVTLMSATLFASTEARAGCEKDTDCKGDRICEAAVCVNPGAPAAPTKAAEPTEAAEPAEGDAPAETAAPEPEEEVSTATDPKDWWKEATRKQEVPVLQTIFDQMPRPIRKKGNAKLVYHRAVPLVVSDIHTTTTRWGGKKQIGVHFMGISKVHTTTTMDPIKEETGGIPYCPVNCARITDIRLQGDDIAIFYDGPIKEWAGKVADNAAGYTRKMGKQYRTMCTFPTMYNHAPKNSWLDPKEVGAVKKNAVAEIKRYCGMD
jgi:hypothetical protein